MSRENGGNENRAFKGISWRYTRFLPQDNSVEEIKRCFDLVWTTIYKISEENSGEKTVKNIVTVRNSTNSSVSSYTIPIPAWVLHIQTPFGVFDMKSDGTPDLDERGYGKIRVIT